MNKLKLNDFFNIAAIIAICICFPQVRQSIFFVLIEMLQIFEQFFLKDFLIEKSIYIGVLILANVLGFYLTRKQKGKIKYYIGGVLNIIGLIEMYFTYRK